jgi:hypothetical protein
MQTATYGPCSELPDQTPVKHTRILVTHYGGPEALQALEGKRSTIPSC